MTEWDPEAWTRNLIADMRANGGVPSTGPMAGETLLILTTTGAKTGEPRTSIVNYHHDGDAWVIAASKGGADTNPAWYYNILANPEVTIEVDNEVLQARANVTRGTERDHLWDDHVRALPKFGEYPSKTDRVIPMIRLERIPQPAGASR
jgi:deazaflavin-dependent oxidoreductase (nitroreductase family)